ncbi:MAG: PHP domain-containing protein [Thermoplasmatota archaeon]
MLRERRHPLQSSLGTRAELGNGGGWRLDLHVHSTASPDGLVRPEELVRIAARAGLSGLALTDHDSVEGLGRACEEARAAPEFILVPGIEVSSAGGHVIGLGVDRRIRAGMTVEETVEAIRAAGGMPVAPHPFRTITGVGGAAVRSARFEAVEVLNGRSPGRKNLRSARLCAELSLGQSAGSDAHRSREVGRCFVVLESDPGGADGLLEMVRRGRARASGRSATLVELAGHISKIGGDWLRRGCRRV